MGAPLDFIVSLSPNPLDWRLETLDLVFGYVLRKSLWCLFVQVSITIECVCDGSGLGGGLDLDPCYPRQMTDGSTITSRWILANMIIVEFVSYLQRLFSQEDSFKLTPSWQQSSDKQHCESENCGRNWGENCYLCDVATHWIQTNFWQLNFVLLKCKMVLTKHSSDNLRIYLLCLIN